MSSVIRMCWLMFTVVILKRHPSLPLPHRRNRGPLRTLTPWLMLPCSHPWAQIAAVIAWVFASVHGWNWISRSPFWALLSV